MINPSRGTPWYLIATPEGTCPPPGTVMTCPSYWNGVGPARSSRHTESTCMPSRLSRIVSYSMARSVTAAIAWIIDPVSGIVRLIMYQVALTCRCCCPDRFPAASRPNNRLAAVRIHALERRLAFRHHLTARDRLGGGALDHR